MTWNDTLLEDEMAGLTLFFLGYIVAFKSGLEACVKCDRRVSGVITWRDVCQRDVTPHRCISVHFSHSTNATLQYVEE